MSKIIRPQPGPQEAFLASSASIVCYGGAAGGGKTWGLLMEPLRHIGNPEFGAVIFRRTYSQITAEGGLWDESEKVYPLLGATANSSSHTWTFPSGAKISMRHLQHEKNKLDWQGAQVPLILFDELTHFSQSQFFYLLSRNRSTCGVRPYLRGSCNPDPDSWLRSFLDWWIDEDGYPDPDRAGRLRYFVRESGELHWADDPDELTSRFPDSQPKSVTFIPSKLEDNQILLDADPSYRANLLAQDRVTRAQLLDGNWNVRAAAGQYFKRSYFPIAHEHGAIKRVVRYWDMAATKPSASNPDPDWLAGALLGEREDGDFVLLDLVRTRRSPGGVEQVIKTTSRRDADRYGRPLDIYIEQEPGSSGKSVISHYKRVLAGLSVHGDRPTGSKEDRAKPASAAAEGQLIHLLEGDWNAAFLREAEGFPDAGHDDQVDALSGAFTKLTEARRRVAGRAIRID